MYTSPVHQFHIPVMGLAYTIDTPIKVARFGIASVISIIEDRLIESMRRHYYLQSGEMYQPITTSVPDYRARRITDYLNLVNRIVQQQVEKLRTSAFEEGADIVKYFELLPGHSKLKQLYIKYKHSQDKEEKVVLENTLRAHIQPGSIDVNIMTKVDKNNLDDEGHVVENGSDALASLKGYADSNLTNSSVIFSAGMNPRLYNYLEKFDAFDADEQGIFQKKVVIKVSDYRSALIQGKYLAKKGIWVSEFRIESGLNCGGHAFATEGYLLGPILEEFKNKRTELASALFPLYNEALKAKGKTPFSQPHPTKITVQGGIGTFEEDDLLHRYYGVESTGWGTPFLLVPEATTVDEPTLQLLAKATEKDVYLSKNSPLGVRFHYLKGTTSDVEKKERIQKGRPGSPCTEKHLVTNTEFTKEPICTASLQYQKLKLAQLQTMDLPEPEYKKQEAAVLDKECLCIGLSNAAALVYKTPFLKKLEAVTICPGPNIAYFSGVFSLQQMVDHIYGRADVLQQVARPHMFTKELTLYLDYLKEQLAEEGPIEAGSKRQKYYTAFVNNLLDGMAHYYTLIQTPLLMKPATAEKLEKELQDAGQALRNIQELVN